MSDLGNFRQSYARALGQLKRRNAELEELREQYRQAGQDERTEITRRGQALHLLKDAAEQDLRSARARLEAEEQRLLQPGAFLRFT
jgi:hypothetical protein